MVTFALVSDWPEPTIVISLLVMVGVALIFDSHAAGSRDISDNYCLSMFTCSAKSY